MKTLCTLAAVALVLFSLGDAIHAASQPQIDDTVTGSIPRGTTPASYGLKYRLDVQGF